MQKNEKGMTLVEVMIAFGLLMTLSLGVLYIMSQLQKANLAGTVKSNAQEIRRNFTSMLENDAAWTHTFLLERNKTFECVRKHRDCRPELNTEDERPGLPYAVYNASNGLYFDGTALKVGYTIGGAGCMNFPSRLCALRPTLSWRPICPQGEGTECFPQQVEILGRILYDPGPDAPADARIPFNPENYSFRIMKNILNAAPVSDKTNPPSGMAPSENEAPNGMAGAQKEVFCKQYAPILRAQSPETIKQTMRSFGYGEAMISQIDQIMKQCP